MSITIGQLASRYKAAARKVTPEATKEFKALAQVGVGLTKREIQKVHAVDTATMLNSTDVEMSGPKTALIGPTVEYAPYVALGTSRMAARPFHIAAAAALNKQAGLFGFDAEKLGL